MIRLDEFSYTEGKHTANLTRLLLSSNNDMRGDKTLRLESDFLNADVTGVFSFSNLVGAFDLFIRNYLASFNLKDSLRVANHSAPQLMRFIVEFG
jgi:hypothetical protein